MRRGALLLALWTGVAVAAPPPGADLDSRIGRWVRTLRDGRGVGCCDLADCRPTMVRFVDDHVEAWIGKEQFGDYAPDAWLSVSRDVIEGTVSDGPAPDARTWACFYGGAVRCLRPGGGT